MGESTVVTETTFPDMETEVWFCRVNDYIMVYHVESGATCPQCNSGECYSPMQQMVPPHIYMCLRCGHAEDNKEFKS